MYKNFKETYPELNLKDEVVIQHRLYAIRMNWLRFLLKPLVFIWKFFLEVFKTIFSSIKPAFNVRVLMTGALSMGLFFCTTIIFGMIGGLVKLPELTYVGEGLGLLFFASGISAISYILKSNDNNNTLHWYKGFIKDHFIYGTKCIVTFINLFIALIGLLLIQVILNFIGKIPYFGNIFHGATFFINFLSSLFAIILLVIILITIFIIPVSSAEQKRPFKETIFHIFNIFKKRPLFLIFTEIFTVIIALILNVIPLAIVSAATGVSAGSSSSITGENFITNLISFFSMGVAIVNKPITMAMGYLGYGNPTTISDIGGFLFGISYAFILGVGFMVFMSHFSSTAYKAYNRIIEKQ